MFDFDRAVVESRRVEIKPLVAQTFPLSDIHTAQEVFLRKEFVGKLVLLP